MKKYLLLFSLLALLPQAATAVTIFKCQLPVSNFDPTFQQGQELYLDVLWENQAPRVLLYRSFGPKVEVKKNLPMLSFGFANAYSSFQVTWLGRKSYLSMVYLGGETWGAYLKYENPVQGLPKESELICTEKINVTQL